MNPISITVTGRLGDDPRTFTTRDGTDGVELRLALDLPARTPGGEAHRLARRRAGQPPCPPRGHHHLLIHPPGGGGHPARPRFVCPAACVM